MWSYRVTVSSSGACTGAFWHRPECLSRFVQCGCRLQVVWDASSAGVGGVDGVASGGVPSVVSGAAPTLAVDLSTGLRLHGPGCPRAFLHPYFFFLHRGSTASVGGDGCGVVSLLVSHMCLYERLAARIRCRTVISARRPGNVHAIASFASHS